VINHQEKTVQQLKPFRMLFFEQNVKEVKLIDNLISVVLLDNKLVVYKGKELEKVISLFGGVYCMHNDQMAWLMSQSKVYIETTN